MKTRLAATFLLVLSVLGFSAQAHAAPVIRLVSIEASNFVAAGAEGTPPYATVSLAFKIAFDTALPSSGLATDIVSNLPSTYTDGLRFGVNGMSIFFGKSASSNGVSYPPYGNFNDVAGAFYADANYLNALNFDKTLIYGTSQLPQYGAGTVNISISEALASPVPEPAAWAMLIVGFLAIGTVVRRKGTARPQLA